MLVIFPHATSLSYHCVPITDYLINIYTTLILQIITFQLLSTYVYVLLAMNYMYIISATQISKMWLSCNVVDIIR